MKQNVKYLLNLRKASFEDVDILYTWANDKECRKNSFNQEKIEYKSHVNWFRGALENPLLDMYILEDGKDTVGTIRVAWNDLEGLISYSISNDFRGRGYGKAILKEVEKKYNQNKKGYKLIGYVKEENIPSLKIFRSLGYSEEIENSSYKFTKII